MKSPTLTREAVGRRDTSDCSGWAGVAQREAHVAIGTGRQAMRETRGIEGSDIGANKYNTMLISDPYRDR